jgi:hypothetical protein
VFDVDCFRDALFELGDVRAAVGEPATIEDVVYVSGELLAVADVGLTDVQDGFEGRRSAEDCEIADRCC